MRLAPLSGSHQSAANRDKSFAALIDQIRRHPLTEKVALGHTRRHSSVHHTRRGTVKPAIIGPTAVSFNVYGQDGGIQHLTAYTADPKGLAAAFRCEQEAETMELHTEHTVKANGSMPAGDGLPIVHNRGGRVVASSRDVADFFGKRHDNVLRDVDNLLKDLAPQNRGALFSEASDFDEGANRVVRRFEMTRDGFSLLAMGFTGQKALQFKLAYIDAFNRMEAALQQSGDQLGNDAAVAVLVQIRDHLDGQNQQISAVKSDQSALVEMMSAMDARLQAVEQADPAPVAQAAEPVSEPVYMTISRWCRVRGVEFRNPRVLIGASRMLRDASLKRGIEIRHIEKAGYRRNTYPDTLMDEFADQIRNKVT